MPIRFGKALIGNKVFCEYQPIVNTLTRDTVFVETLVRHHDENGNVAYPSSFIESIANKKLMAYLTQEVFWYTCKQFTDSNQVFSINLPLSAIRDKGTATMLEIFIRNGNLGERIVFEINEKERNILQQSDIEFLEIVKDLGVRIAIDDFGTIVSSFDFLDKLSPDFIKLDGSLFNTFNDRLWAKYNIQKIVEYAKDRGMRTIAEQVDSEEKLDLVLSTQIEMFQGNLHCQPINPEIGQSIDSIYRLSV